MFKKFHRPINLKRQNRHGRLKAMLAVVLMSVSVVYAVHAQTTPWPVKEFEVEWEWNKSVLEKDLKTAATFFEKKEFHPPNLEVVEKESLLPFQDDKPIHQVHVNDCSDPGYPCAEASYDAGRACSLQNLRSEARASIRSGQRPPIQSATIQPPTIQSAVGMLQSTIPLVQTIALPHELFHAVQFSYFSFLKQCSTNGAPDDWGTTTDAWFREGMADAMALEWLKRARTQGQIDTYKTSRVRGWRNYRAPLAITDEWETYGYDAQVRKPLQAYKTSSFWRFLRPELIRAVLEYDGVSRDMDSIDWLDQALQEEWAGICKRAFPGGVPNKQGNIPCEDASEYAGLYLMYPMFITKFAESERDKGGLDVIFAGVESTRAGIVERGSGEGCIEVKPSPLSSPLEISLLPVAAECLRVPSEFTGKLFVHATILGAQKYENLILGWNGCIQSLGSVVYDPDVETMAGEAAPDKSKVWPVNREVQAGINGCESLKPGEDLLLVLSNIAPKASDTEPIQVRLTLLRDEG